MKMATFIPTLQKQAAVWIVQYGATHFATFDLLREAFLLRFREEKTCVHVLAKLGRLEQKNQSHLALKMHWEEKLRGSHG